MVFDFQLQKKDLTKGVIGFQGGAAIFHEVK